MVLSIFNKLVKLYILIKLKEQLILKDDCFIGSLYLEIVRKIKIITNKKSEMEKIIDIIFKIFVLLS